MPSPAVNFPKPFVKTMPSHTLILPITKAIPTQQAIMIIKKHLSYIIYHSSVVFFQRINVVMKHCNNYPPIQIRLKYFFFFTLYARFSSMVQIHE